MEKHEVYVTYELETKVETPERSLDLLLAEMTAGIQYVSTRDGVKMDRIQDTLPVVNGSILGRIVSVEKSGEGLKTTFALPLSNLDVGLGGLTNLWPMVAGEVFNFHFVRRAELVDLRLPPPFEKYYLGPGFGIEGMRKLLGIEKGPIFGSIIKPNLGLDPDGTAERAALLARAGFNFIKDDEICVNPDICPVKKRMRAISEALDKVEQAEGRKVIYAANVTADFAVMHRAAETAVKAGATGLMIDPFCTGLSGIDFLRRNFDLPIYAHRVGYGIFCLGQTYSIRYEVFTKLMKLLGADFSHVGGIWGKSEASRKRTASYLRILRDTSSGKSAWPVVTGISLENMADYYDFYGDDTMFMDHIDIYTDEEASKRKLQALKEKIS